MSHCGNAASLLGEQDLAAMRIEAQAHCERSLSDAEWSSSINRFSSEAWLVQLQSYQISLCLNGHI